MKTSPASDTLVPERLVAEIEAAAAEERRAPGDIVAEALERYLSERKWLRKDETHAKIARGLESLRGGRGLDGEAVMAELLADLDASDPAR
jgi:predicted transcriptional regulator